MKWLGISKQNQFATSGVECEPSHDLLYCDMFAAMLTYDRRLAAIDLPQMVGGIYLGYEDATRYWDEVKDLRAFVIAECDRDRPKWFYYAELYDHLKRRSRRTFAGKRMQRSQVLRKIFEVAIGCSKSRDLRGRSGKPVMIPEDLLFAIAQRSDLQFCDNLLKSGLSVDRVRAVVIPSKKVSDR